MNSPYPQQPEQPIPVDAHGNPAYAGIPAVPPDASQALVQEGAAEQNDTGAKGLSLAVALGINALILLLLAWWGLSNLVPEEVELVLEAGTSDSPTEIDKKQFQQKQQTKPTPASGSKSPPMITSVVVDPTATFVVESKVETDAFGIGDGWGKGAGFGSGGGGGGSVGFFGSRSTAQRVVFIIDVSASLNSQQFTMIKEELNKSLNKLASSIQYQVIFFNGPAWFAGDEMTGSRTYVVKNGGKKYTWKTKGGASQYYIEGEKELYTSKWLQATSTNLRKTKEQVKEVRKAFGTDWRHPLKMALSMDPKPDVVYFLTDGAVSNGQQAVDQTVKINGRGGKKAKINTIAMMQPRAQGLLAELADKTGGEFTIVMGDGTVKRPKK